MNRRTLLTAISGGAATVAGCTGGDEDDGRKYEECDRRFLDYRILPRDVKAEVDTAFNEGRYESDEELLWEQVAGPRLEALARDGSYYAPQVDVENSVHILQFEEITPQYDSTKHLTVIHVPEVPLEISIAIKDTEGEVLDETDLTIEDRDSNQEAPIANEFGTYLVEVTVEDWGSVTEELTLGPFPEPIRLGIIGENDETDQRFSVAIESGSDSDYDPCPWEW